MAERIFMPKAGMAMEEGLIVRWLLAEGETVSRGEPIVEIETDKVTLEVEAEASGTLLQIVRGEGETVPVIETIGWIGEPGEEIPEETGGDAEPAEAAALAAPAVTAVTENESAPTIESAAGGKIRATPAARRVAQELSVDLALVRPTGAEGEITSNDVKTTAERQSTVRATPLARGAARADGVDLASVEGSGSGGKIRRDDLPRRRVATAGIRSVEPRETIRIPIEGTRRVIAQRMTLSHETIPAATLHGWADVTELVAAREKINQFAPQRVTINDFVLLATAVALIDHPLLRGRIEENTIVCEADKARMGGLGPDDYTGGVFTVTNLGRLGVTHFTPIINPPETAILGVGTIEPHVQLEQGTVIERKRMALSLTHDHRSIDGMAAARFLARLRDLLENPLEMIVD